MFICSASMWGGSNNVCPPFTLGCDLALWLSTTPFTFYPHLQVRCSGPGKPQDVLSVSCRALPPALEWGQVWSGVGG